jgi:hypothetical protein
MGHNQREDYVMRLAILFAAMVASTSAVAQSKPIPSATAFDVATDAKAFSGKVVRVTECEFYNAKLTTINCGVFAANGKQIGSILVDVKSLDAMSRKQVLSLCAGDEVSDTCKGAVVGRAKLVLGEYVMMMNSRIEFE